MNPRRLMAVARKESLHLIRDWRSLALALAIPLILILLYGYALTLDLRNVPTVVWDQSRTPESRELLSIFHNSPYFTVKGYCDNYQGVQRALDRGLAMVAVVIPGDFAAKVQAAEPVKIQILGDAVQSGEGHLKVHKGAVQIRSRLQAGTPAHQQVGSKVIFQRSDPLTNSGGGDSQLIGGPFQRPDADRHFQCL